MHQFTFDAGVEDLVHLFRQYDAFLRAEIRMVKITTVVAMDLKNIQTKVPLFIILWGLYINYIASEFDY